MVRINFEDLREIREKFKDKKIVFCSGTFDLTHVGHSIFFEDCKKFGNLLIVSIGSDLLVKKNKGPQRPILNQFTRLKMVDSLKSVDYVVLDEFFREDNSLKGIIEMIKKLKPDVYVVNDDAFDICQRKKIAEEFSCGLKILKRRCPKEFENISSSKIIDKIKRIENSSEKKIKINTFCEKDYEKENN